MSEKVKALVNNIFIQLNRHEKQQTDFAPDAFLRDCEAYFSELDRLDLSADGGAVVDEHLKSRINTAPRNAQPLTLTTLNLLALYFWYVRRPAMQHQNAFLAAKKLRGSADDSHFVEQIAAPLIFGGKIWGFSKQERQLRTMLLHRTAQIAANFRETDQLPASATRIIRTDSWQKKMIHIAFLNQQGRKAEIRSFAPGEELRLMSSQNEFVEWYLRTNEIYKGENALARFLGRFFAALGSALLSVFNYRFVFHVLRDRWPVYVVYVILVALSLYFSLNMRHYWESAHRTQGEKLTQAAKNWEAQR